LYLTVQDAIALALENNIDLETDRYQPLIDQWNVQLYQGGGALPGVPVGSSQVSTVVSGQGVTGSQQAAGVGRGNGNSGGATTANATISQLGPTTPALDPVIQQSAVYIHKSTIEPDLIGSDVFNLVDNEREYPTSITEGLITGGRVTLSYSDSYDRENAPTNTLNPSNATSISFSMYHNFLQGFGIPVNSRFITVAKANLKLDDLNFKGEVISVVANVLNLYYGLVADYEDLKARQSAFSVAQQFYENNKKQVQIGTMAPLDVTTAEAQVASTQQDLVVSETTLEQQQVELKNVLSRNGLADPVIREAQIIPLDRIDVPERDDLPPLKTLITSALTNRTDIAANKISLSNAQISALGTANSVLPTLQAQVTASNSGLEGVAQAVPLGVPLTNLTGNTTGVTTVPTTPGSIPAGLGPCPAPNSKEACELANPYVVGNIGTALGQTLRRDFPSESVGAVFATPLRNRQALADQVIDTMTMRQTELSNVRASNQIAVDVSNQVIGLEQARVRYLAAVKNRILEQQLLEAEQKRFSLGASTTFLVVQQQRDLATAQSSETAALVAYSNARVSLDQTLGTTLDTNHVTVSEALGGRVSRASTLPATLPAQP
jgi:outer membrane protein TolC